MTHHHITSVVPAAATPKMVAFDAAMLNGQMWLPTGNGVVGVNPQKALPVHGGANSVAASAHFLWVEPRGNSHVLEMNPSNGKVIRTITGGGSYIRATTGSTMWMVGWTGGSSAQLIAVNENSGRTHVVLPASSHRAVGCMAAHGTSLWAATYSPQNSGMTHWQLTTVNTSTQKVVRSVALPSGVSCQGLNNQMTYANGRLWMTGGMGGTGQVFELNPATSTVIKRISPLPALPIKNGIGNQALAVASNGTSVWALVSVGGAPVSSNNGGGSWMSYQHVVKIDPTTGATLTAATVAVLNPAATTSSSKNFISLAVAPQGTAWVLGATAVGIQP